jgi:hypothetical protein
VNNDRDCNDNAILRATPFNELFGVLHDTLHFLTHGGVIAQLLLENFLCSTGAVLRRNEPGQGKQKRDGKQKFFHNDYFE